MTNAVGRVYQRHLTVYDTQRILGTCFGASARTHAAGWIHDRVQGRGLGQSTLNGLMQDDSGRPVKPLLAPDIKQQNNTNNAKVKIQVIHKHRIYRKTNGTKSTQGLLHKNFPDFNYQTLGTHSRWP
jgi:hypothetical protein